MPDFWSLVTGLASILSLLIALADKSATWKKYTLPAAYVLGGFAVGRITSTGSQSLTNQSLTIFILLFVGVCAYLSLKLIAKKEYAYAYMIFIFGLPFCLPAMTKYFEQDGAALTFDDALEVAVVKEQSGELQKAETYYRLAAKSASSDEARKRLIARANEVQEARMKRLLKTSDPNSQQPQPSVLTTVTPP